MNRIYDPEKINTILKILEIEYKSSTTALEFKTPFQLLISTMLAAQSTDKRVNIITEHLYTDYPDADSFLALEVNELEEKIKSIGLYKAKAKNILATCRILVDEYGGEIPKTREALMKLPGVGRKTANLVLTVGFGDYGICVDTHVHRISNLWGYVNAKTPDQTEFALRKKLPRRHWKTFNDILVTFGQNLCLPVSPWCSKCPIAQHCPRIGLKRSR